MNSTWYKRRKRLFEIIEVAIDDDDYASRIYDLTNVLAIIFNLLVSILYTFSKLQDLYGDFFILVEKVTVAFFAIDYILRLITARFLYPDLSEPRAVIKYICSFTGFVDMLSFLPYYLPIFFPTGSVAFRMIRIVRIFRLFRINAYYDSLNVITEVISGKRQQLISSVFIILVLMLASSLCMYSLEHEAQPDVFTNAFSGIWWSASTLLTVGYGDIYPITTFGKLFGISITFLGVGMVAIPTGIISAGFVDQYSSIKKQSEYGHEADMHFIKIFLRKKDNWIGKSIAELQLPAGVIVAVVKREGKVLIPRGNMILRMHDTVVIGAEPFDEKENEHIQLKEIVLQKQNPWTGERIRDLDISRQSIIVLVKRQESSMIPYGNLVLREGDHIFLYTHKHMAHAMDIKI